MGQRSAAYDANGNITAFYDSVDSPVPAGVTSFINISDAEWQACLAQPGWTVQDGMLVAPPPPPLPVPPLDPVDHTFGGDLWQSSIV
ncbi:hypothetical protein OKW39_009022 [Paraburkholderia sp. MM6662-R1]